MKGYQQAYWLQIVDLIGEKLDFDFKCDPSFFDQIWTGEHMAAKVTKASIQRWRKIF